MKILCIKILAFLLGKLVGAKIEVRQYTVKTKDYNFKEDIGMDAELVVATILYGMGGINKFFETYNDKFSSLEELAMRTVWIRKNPEYDSKVRTKANEIIKNLENKGI